ncbi:hypothetical protein ACF05W_36690 [Streptomyces lydicus]|uniref:hypothetical protein n=1 Tax=Streptomyces lydicus TaxID=47763 RepID=UPI0037031245
MDLTAHHPRTGELLSTVKFMVQTLAAAGELQRELTYDGLRATGCRGQGQQGRAPPAIGAEKTDAVRTAYLEGRSIAALARDHGVSHGAIRTAVADLMPEHTAADGEEGEQSGEEAVGRGGADEHGAPAFMTMAGLTYPGQVVLPR